METGSDRIEIRGLRSAAVVGVLPEERERPQPVELDLTMWVDLTAAGESDRIDDTVDYAEVCSRVGAVVSEKRPRLLELLAACVADEVLAADDRIEVVEVSVRKTAAPVGQLVDSVGVRIRRRSAGRGGGG